ncbi:MAG: response regulator [Spirochaetales bacterium]|nr:response regulator [Spirochaetales bacterium]MCF7939367.1 response regulator [Spirochaetales bacterium]
MSRQTSILIIDDETLLRKSVRDYLEDSGYTVQEAENGKTGIELIEQKLPDLVICDLRMPETDGFEVLDYISEHYPRTPSIVISGNGIIHDAVDALKRGAWDYLIKPIEDMGILEHAVNTCLERRRLENENEKYRRRLENKVQMRTRELEEEIQKREERENQIRSSLTEKEVLLIEVNNRVKNNMQLMISILNLQAEYARDEYHRNLFEESLNRLKTMALVHESLYKADDLARINIQSYLEELVGHLVHFYKEEKDIHLSMSIHPIVCSIRQAIPLGLIVNELVVNALQYAFRGRSKGELYITTTKQGDQVEMCIGDDGIGLSEDIDIQKTESLGFQLVVNLSEQMGAAIDLQRRNGTLFTLTFTIENESIGGSLPHE